MTKYALMTNAVDTSTKRKAAKTARNSVDSVTTAEPARSIVEKARLVDVLTAHWISPLDIDLTLVMSPENKYLATSPAAEASTRPRKTVVTRSRPVPTTDFMGKNKPIATATAKKVVLLVTSTETPKKVT